MFPLLALLFAFHILKNKKQTSKQNFARAFFPKLPAVSQILLQRCSAASHWGAHLRDPPAGRAASGSVHQVDMEVSMEAPQGLLQSL